MQRERQTVLKDETAKILNSYFSKINQMPVTFQSNVPQPEKDRSAKNLWPSKLAAKEDIKPKVEVKKLEDRKQTKRVAVLPNKETVRERYKKFENVKITAPFKRTATDDRARYEKGDFGKFLDLK